MLIQSLLRGLPDRMNDRTKAVTGRCRGIAGLFKIFAQFVLHPGQGKLRPVHPYTEQICAVRPGAQAIDRFARGEIQAQHLSGPVDELTCYRYGDFLVETDDAEAGRLLGEVTDDGRLTLGDESISLASLQCLWEDKLESVYPCNIPTPDEKAENISFPAKSWAAPAVKTARPRILIPAFPGTNCEYDSARAVRDAGADARIMVINNLTAEGIARSVEDFAREIGQSQAIFIPGGFSGGDEPDGSAKFITAFFRNQAVREGVTELLEKRDGLMCGICNGFQALIKLGLVPFGKIIDTDETCPTLTFNIIGRHQSRMVRTRIASNRSPWLQGTQVGDIYSVPISHGEGRFLADDATIAHDGRALQPERQPHGH